MAAGAGAATTAGAMAERGGVAMKNLMLLVALAIAATPVAAEPAMVGKTAKGAVLVDAKGMSLYTFDKDGGGASACSGDCAAKWPPLAAGADAKPEGDYAPIPRDGGRQWAYKGQPLYGWVKDHKPGDVTGDGVGGVWHLARP